MSNTQMRLGDGTPLSAVNEVIATDGGLQFRAIIDQPAHTDRQLVLVRLSQEDMIRLELEHEYAWVALENLSACNP